MRVVRRDEVGWVAGLMRRFEAVHPGAEEGARSWAERMTGKHRFTLLLECDDLALAYMLVSVAPAPAADMESIFQDSWKSSSGRHQSHPNLPWATCNFYSINAVNRGSKHPFAGVSVGFPCIKKSGEFLRTHGVRKALSMRGGPIESDLRDVSDDPNAVRLYTMSPVPALSSSVRGLAISSPYDAVAKKDKLIQATKSLIAAQADPVAKFHLGNGAVLHRVNWMADSTPIRMEQSFGIMVNYDYN